MMQKLPALILSVAIAPALGLSTAAFAQEREDMQSGEPGAAAQESPNRAAGERRSGAEGTGQQAGGEERFGEQGAGGQAGAEQDPENRAAGERRSGAQGSGGEQYLSIKPAGALYAGDLIGQNVRHRGSGEDVGEIQDLVIGEDGRVVGVVVTTSGFLGLGGQEVGLGWDHIEHTMENEESVFYTDMDEESLKNAPEYVRE